MAKTVWFDVTRIHSWNEPPVGIVRVQLEIARYLLSGFGTRVRFCRFNRRGEIYVEASPAEVDTYIRRLDANAEGLIPYSYNGVGWKAKGFIKKEIQYLPKRFQTALIQFVRGLRRTVRKATRILLRSIYRRLVNLRLLPPGIDTKMKQGDIYINLDLDLDADTFMRIYEIKRKLAINVVGMCYDLIPIITPHFIASDYSQLFSCFIKNMARCADMIMCISRNTLHDLEGFLFSVNGHRPSLEVITLGENLNVLTGVLSEKVGTACQKSYILYVSTIEVRKNHETLYRAYRKLVEMGRNDIPMLVFAGRPGWGVDKLLSDLRLDQEVNEFITIIEPVNDSELSCLYGNALFTVYPSFYEGWGLPVAESLAHGKFCIASSASSLPEVGGEFVEYIDPCDLPTWIERLAYYFDNPEAIRDREAKIRSEYRTRTWSETTRKIVECAMMLEG
jgi:glycosyltransferase involved in cell wall biosynthesis